LLQNLREPLLLNEFFRVKKAGQIYKILYEASKKCTSIKFRKLKRMLKKAEITIVSVNIDCNKNGTQHSLKKVYGKGNEIERRQSIK
jgi:hypothetical protein